MGGRGGGGVWGMAFFFLGWVARRKGLLEQVAVSSPGCRPLDSGERLFQQRCGRAKFSLSRKNTGNHVLYASTRTTIFLAVLTTCAGIRSR